MASKDLPRTPRKKKSPWVRRVKRGLVLFASIVFLAFSVLGLLYLKAHKEAETTINANLDKNIEAVNKPTSKMLSRDGIVIFSVSAENRIPLKLSQIPKFIQDAVIAAEDRRFYQHSGVDLTSMLRVVFVDVKGGRLAQGGSTITMQLVKLLFNGSSRTFTRKLNDIAYAQVLEQRLPKEQILEIYLNKVFFGEGAFGIGEAAKVYFDKSVDQLTIGEAAMLARCIRRPSVENPIRNIKAAMTNRDVVLGIMHEEHMISDDQYDKALDEKPHVSSKPMSAGIYVAPGAEYFVDHVRSYVEKDLGLDLTNGGYTIETTLDYGLQRKAERVCRAIVDENKRAFRVNQAAFMAMDSDGNILVEVGGLNYRNHQQNLITQGSLQPGSGFKPIVYATALKNGVISMDSRLSNATIREVDPTSGNVWEPSNSSPSEDRGSYSLRDALALSINRCAIHTIKDVGPDAVVQTAYDAFGFKSKLAPYEPLALGSSAVAPVEMAEAYSVFMLRGDRVSPQPVLRVTDNDGNIVKQYEPNRTVGVFDSGVCDEVDELLRGVVEYGTGQAAMVVPDARGKTGTTNDGKDAWFTGYADGVLGVGWVGREIKVKGVWTPQPTSDRTFGGTITAKIWAQIMSGVRDKYSRVIPKPDHLAVEPTKKKKAVEAGPDVDPDLSAPPDDSKKPPTPPSPPDAGDPMVASGQDKTDPVKAGDSKTDPDKPAVKPPVSNADQTKTPKDKPTDPDATAATKTSTPTRSKRATSDDTKSDTVTVDICVDSGLLANAYCPETVRRTFKRGREPKRKCRIHGPEN